MWSNERIKKDYFKELEQSCLIGLAKMSTFVQRKKAVNYFVDFLNASGIRLKDLDSLRLQDFLHFLSQKKTSRDTKLAPATLKQIYALVKSFYVRCYEKRITSQHPDLIFTKNLLLRYKLGERKLPKYIDQHRMKKLLSKCPNRWKALFNFMYDTGARISEVLNVQQDHLDLEKKLVQIYEPKTMNVRVTALSNSTVQLLEEYFSKYRPKPKGRYGKFIFINQQRRKMSPRAVQYIVKGISAEILGRENAITPHYFRAACAVHLLESGVDIRQVQEIIGWKSLTVVQNYTRVTPQRQIQLKEQHHPSFQSQRLELKKHEEKSSILEQMKALRRELAEERRRHHQEITELKQASQQDQFTRMKELQSYEKRHQEAIETLKQNLEQEQRLRMQERQTYEQRVDDLLKAQQQLVQALTQKSS